MVTAIGDFLPGEGATVLPSSTGASIGVSICFESLFPEISRTLVRNGADLLANLTNDAWFGDTAAPHQHLSMLVFRAIETRRWIVRSANTGISAFLDPCGRIPVRTGVFQRAALVDTVSRLQVHSPYTIHGDLFLLGCGVWAGALVVPGLVLVLRGVRSRHALS
jgi:apolipoprotein N-acyltransferase